MRADVAIITAVQVEYQAFFDTAEKHYGMSWEMLERTHKRSFRRYQIAQTQKGLRLALVQASDMGQVHAAILAKDIIADLAPSLILLVGIAAAIGKDLELGDIVCAEQIIDYELGKTTTDGVKHKFPAYRTNGELLQDFKSSRHEWKHTIMAARPERPNDSPRIHFGDVLCGNRVVSENTTTEELLHHYPKAIALEMESYGAACAINHVTAPPHFGMIKGICDRANYKKNDSWQSYAAYTASSYVLGFLSNTSSILPGLGFRTITDQTLKEETDQVIHALGIDPSRIASVEFGLVRTIVSAMLTEASDILSGNVLQRVDHGHQFHLRGLSLFGEAKAVYAISLDSVSTFWANPKNRTTAWTYLKHQAPGGTAKRLFVFSNAESAHRHARVLDAHDDVYKNVCICSMDYYRANIVDRFRGTYDTARLLGQDLGILIYPNDEVKYAELTDDSLAYKRVSLDAIGEVNYRGVVDMFEEFMTIPKGKCGGSDGRILRWDKGMWLDSERWTEVLMGMFPERSFDAFHLLLFDGDDDEDTIRANLADIKKKIMRGRAAEGDGLGKKYGIRQVWFGKPPGRPHSPRDFRLHGLLRVNSDCPKGIVLMHFDEYEQLKRFEEDEQHSTIRQGVYETLDDRIPDLYKIAVQQKKPAGKAVVFDAIEGLLGGKFSRWDFVSTEMVRDIVENTSPYEF